MEDVNVNPIQIQMASFHLWSVFSVPAVVYLDTFGFSLVQCWMKVLHDVDRWSLGNDLFIIRMLIIGVFFMNTVQL